MNPDDKKQAQLLAGSLRSFAELVKITPWLLLLTAGLAFQQPALLWVLFVQLLVSAGQIYLAWRLQWDAELFQALADGLADEAALDKFLSAFRKSASTTRSFESRVTGAQNLMRQLVIITFLLWAIPLLTCAHLFIHTV